jgi:hypothetical protein
VPLQRSEGKTSVPYIQIPSFNSEDSPIPEKSAFLEAVGFSTGKCLAVAKKTCRSAIAEISDRSLFLKYLR